MLLAWVAGQTRRATTAGSRTVTAGKASSPASFKESHLHPLPQPAGAARSAESPANTHGGWSEQQHLRTAVRALQDTQMDCSCCTRHWVVNLWGLHADYPRADWPRMHSFCTKQLPGANDHADICRALPGHHDVTMTKVQEAEPASVMLRVTPAPPPSRLRGVDGMNE